MIYLEDVLCPSSYSEYIVSYTRIFLQISGMNPIVIDLLPERYKYSFLKNIIWLTESTGKEIILCRNDSLRMIISLALIRTISSCADWDSLYTAATCRFHLLLFRISHPYNRLIAVKWLHGRNLPWHERHCGLSVC